MRPLEEEQPKRKADMYAQEKKYQAFSSVTSSDQLECDPFLCLA